MLKNTKAQEK